MKKRYLYRIVFKEDLMNEMLIKGWMPVRFKRLGYCIFEQCEQGKYGCKLIPIDDECKMACDGLTEITKISENIMRVNVLVSPPRSQQYKIDLYYIIYSREKVLELGGRAHISNSSIYYTDKSLKSMIFKIAVEVYLIICSTSIYILLLDKTVYYWQCFIIYLLIFAGIIAGSDTIINRIRGLQTMK